MNRGRSHRIVARLNRYARAYLESYRSKPRGGRSRDGSPRRTVDESSTNPRRVGSPQRAVDDSSISSGSAAALALVALVVGSALAPFLAPVAAAQPDKMPAGFVAIPDQNIKQGTPVSEEFRFRASNLTDADVLASGHASTTEFVLTTPADARSELGPDSTVSGLGNLAIVVRDESAHAGRTIAIRASEVRDALGFLPQNIHGQHEDGSSWSEPVTTESGYITVEIPHFSSNVITFTGEVEIDATPATDGASYQYDVSRADSVSNFSLAVTGRLASEWDNESAAGVRNGDTLAVSTAGESLGGPGGTPSVAFTGRTASAFGGTSPSQEWTKGAGDYVHGVEVGPDSGVYYSSSGEIGRYTESGSLDWSHSLGGTSQEVAVNDDGTVYATVGTTVYAYSQSGSQKWTYSASDSQYGIAVGPDGYVYSGGASGTVHKLDPETGSEQWTNNLGAGAIYAIGANDVTSAVFVGHDGSQGNVTRVNTAGNIDWQNIGVDGGGITGIDINDDGKLIAGYVYQLHELEPSTGTQEWSGGIAGEDVHVDPTGNIYGAAMDHGLVKHDPSGNKIWNQSLDDQSHVTVGLGPTGRVAVGEYKSFGYWSQPAETTDPGLDVDSDGTPEAVVSGTLSSGETVTRDLSELSASTSSVTVVSAGGTAVDVELKFKEKVSTPSGGVEVNGNWTNFTALNDGETRSLFNSTDWIRTGINRVNVSLDTDAIGADAPAPVVGLAYSHTSRDDVSVSYRGETWSERYEVSRTWGSANQNATLRIPFAGNVVRNRALTVYRNGTETPPTWSRYRNTTLEVGLGDLKPGTTTRIVANGSKVVVENGAIRVTDPTTAGNALNTSFEVISKSEGFRIDVSGTESADWVHYLANASWQNANASTRIANGGSDQYLRLPNAPEGGTARARTLALSADPQNDVEVEVEDPTDPRFRIAPGEVAGDSLDLAYYDTESGVTYELVSETYDRIESSDTADSPARFSLDSDAANLLSISVADSGGTVSPSSGGGGGVPPLKAARDVASDPLANPLLVLGAGAVVILGVGLLARRRGVPVWASGGVLGLVFIVALESLAPRVLSGAVAQVVAAVGSGVGRVSSALALGGGVVAIWGVFRLVKKFTSPDRTILRIRGEK